MASSPIVEIAVARRRRRRRQCRKSRAPPHIGAIVATRKRSKLKSQFARDVDKWRRRLRPSVLAPPTGSVSAAAAALAKVAIGAVDEPPAGGPKLDAAARATRRQRDDNCLRRRT